MSARVPGDPEALLAHIRNLRYEPETLTVSVHDIAKFASSIGATDAVYFDRAAATKRGYRAVVAPRAFYMALGTTRGRLIPRSGFGEDGLPLAENLADFRLVVGGTSVEFHEDIYAGDVVTVKQGVGFARIRRGRSGWLVIVDLVRRYERSDGLLLVVETITRIVR
jgi:hypothetical protein